MNSDKQFIPIEQAIWRIERRIANKSLLGNILQYQGFLDLKLYAKNENGNIALVEDFDRLALYKSIKDEYPVTKFSELKSVSKINKSNNYGLVGAVNRAQKILSMIPPEQHLLYYWRKDDFCKKLDNNKSQEKSVVYSTNKIASDEQKELQLEMTKLKEDLAEQKYQLKNKNEEVTNLQSQLDQAHARITELEQQLQSNQSENNTPTYLPCFDEANIYTYPPELDKAIKIWVEIYQTDNIPKHLTNHSDKFTQACKNLGFSFTGGAVKERLKKITTPQNRKEKTKSQNSLK